MSHPLSLDLRLSSDPPSAGVDTTYRRRRRSS